MNKKVELIGVLRNPNDNLWETEDYVVAGALGCFDERTSSKIHENHKVNNVPYKTPKKSLDWDETKELILKETSGRGHGAVLDQAEFVYSIGDLSRASTLFLCGPQYAQHLQQSLRRSNAERGFAEPVSDLEIMSDNNDIFEVRGITRIHDKKGDSLMEAQFELYEAMKNSQIPAEDARFILPLYTKTAIQSKWNARELMHLLSMSQRMNVPGEIRDTVNEMYQLATKEAPKLMKDRKRNLEVLAWMPSPQLFAQSNPILQRLISQHPIQNYGAKILGADGNYLMSGEEIGNAIINRDEAALSVLKNYHSTFLGAMSLSTFHQATRQRTWDQSVEALPDAVKRGEYITPPSIVGTEFERDYRRLSNESINFVKKNLENPESLGILPHSLKVYDLMHINGFNALHAVGKRTCDEAQWEVRGIATNIAEGVRENYPELGNYSVPQGRLYGKCPERKPCGKCFKK